MKTAILVTESLPSRLLFSLSQYYACIHVGQHIERTDDPHPAYSVARVINEQVLSVTDTAKLVVIMDVNVLFNEYYGRSAAFGADILEAMRIYDTFGDVHNASRKVPVLMYSWESAEQLLRRIPGVGKIFSPGTAFIQFPISDDDFLAAVENAGNLPPISTEDFFHYFQAAPVFANDQTRHSQANQFGLVITASLLQALYSSKSKHTARECTIIPPIGPDIGKLLFRFNRKLKDVETPVEQDNRTAFFKNISRIKNNLGSRRIALIDNEGSEVAGLPGFGWKKTLEALLDNPEVIEDIFASHAYNVDGIIADLSRNHYASVLLDIRFPVGETENAYGEKEYFGLHLLKRIRQHLPAMPIIIVTSINKTWRHREYIESGADAIWVKEGIDEMRTPKESLHNLIRLLELIRRTTGPEYTFLFRLNRAIEYLQQHVINTKSWKKKWVFWAKHSDSHSTHSVDAAIIIEILQGAFSLMRTFTKDSLMNFSENPKALLKELTNPTPNKRSDYSKLVVNYAAKIIEAVHGAEFAGYKDRVTAGLIGGHGGKTERGDWLGYWLYNLRNECSHHFPQIEYDLFTNNQNHHKGRCAQNYLAFIVAYLCTDTLNGQSYDNKFYSLSKEPNRNEKKIVNDDFLIILKSEKGMSDFFTIYEGILFGSYPPITATHLSDSTPDIVPNPTFPHRRPKRPRLNSPPSSARPSE